MSRLRATPGTLRFVGRMSGAGPLYVIAAALGVTSLVLASWGWRVARRLDAQVTRAAFEHGELLAREYAEIARLVTDASAARVFGVLQQGGDAWLGDVPRRIEESIALTRHTKGARILPNTGGVFAWRSDRPERIEARGLDSAQADAIRRQVMAIAPLFTNERAAPMVVKTDADGREILAASFFRARGSLVQAAGYMSSPEAFADSILRPIAERVSEERYGASMEQVVAWRVIRPGGDTVALMGTFAPAHPMVATAPFRPRFQTDTLPAEAATTSTETLDASRVTTRLDPRRYTYRLEVQVHPDALGRFLYGATLAPAMSIAALVTLTIVLTIAAVVLARRFVRHVQEREAFATAVAHDLRTPLTQILLYGESMQLDRPTPQAREAAARVIVRETRRLIHIVENALQFERGGRAHPTLSLEPLSLPTVVRDTVEAMSPLLAQMEVTVSAHLVPELSIVADRTAFSQILTNLLENAVRFGPRAQEISLSAEASGNFVELRVDDRGPGIPASLREEIFRPFVRAGRSPGAGIGLAVSRQLAELMDGSLTAGEAPGGGARLALRLPLAS